MTSLRFLPWPVARLKPYAKNARTPSDDQIAKIAASLVEHGWTAPVCWRRSISRSTSVAGALEVRSSRI